MLLANTACFAGDSVTVPMGVVPSFPSEAETPSEPQKPWAAVAAGMDDGNVGVGIARNYPTEEEAGEAAVENCERNVSSCHVVRAWNSGCFFITSGSMDNRVGWGSGYTAQQAFDYCVNRNLNCNTNTLGHCYR
jgi:hypothetical protein